MPGPIRFQPFDSTIAFFLLTLGLIGCTASRPAASGASPAPQSSAPPPVSPPVPPIRAALIPPAVFPVMTGIDVLESEGFAILKGKRVGLLTHPAAVDRKGRSTIEILRHAPGVQLVALFAPEHGVYSEYRAGVGFSDHVDPRTGLIIHSLYNGVNLTHKPTRGQLKGIDVFVVDLQDIGTRSYTFVSAMKTAMEGCFEAGVEFVVLDRPNPLGGLKADGPTLDPQLTSYVGEFRVPYVHGLTMAELARMAKEAPDVLSVSEAVREAGKLVIIPMRGWRRGMRWPETGLTWVPTSQYIPDFQAVEGCPMTGLGTQLPSPFSNGVGTQYPFRGLSCRGVKSDVLDRDLRALHLPGIDFRRVSVPNPKTGQPGTGLYVEITDWDAWNPTELNFYLMRLACKYEAKNPFAAAARTPSERLEFQMLSKLLGSSAFIADLAAHGSRTDVEGYVREWKARAAIYQQQSRRYWLYY